MKISKIAKKIFLYVFIALTVSSSTALFLAPKIAYAQSEPAELHCWVGGGVFPDLDLEGCIAQGAQLIHTTSSYVLIASGGVFDSMLAFSLSKSALNQQFIIEGWKAVRDVANLFFIFIMLYIAIATILQAGGIQLKKMLVNVIIVALVINFSFFFTRIIIDASNIFAMEFYTAIGSVSTNNSSISPSLGVPERSIASVFVGAMGPQKILSSKSFEIWENDTGYSKPALTFVFLVGTTINLVTAYVLFYAGFLLLTRVVAFMFLIIASPLAFMAYIMPGQSGFSTKWWSQLTSQALLAPVFLFFLYIITKMISTGYVDSLFVTGSNFSAFLTTLVLSTAVVITALLIALKTAKKLSGEAGAFVGKLEGRLKGAAKVAATGGAAAAGFVAQQTAGRLASKAQEKMQESGYESRKPFRGAVMSGVLNKIGAKKYDKWKDKGSNKITSRGARASALTFKEKQEAGVADRKMKMSLEEDKIKMDKAGKAANSSILSESGRAEAKSKFEEAKKTYNSANKSYNESKGGALKIKRRRAAFLANISGEKDGKFKKAVNKISGRDRLNREATVKIKKGEDGKKDPEASFLESLMEKAQKKAQKDLEGNSAAKAKSDEFKA